MKTSKQKRDTAMNVKTCPACRSRQVGVLDSRDHRGLKVRRRECQSCGHRFSSVEISRDNYMQLRRAATAMTQVKESMACALALVDARIEELGAAIDLDELGDLIPPIPRIVSQNAASNDAEEWDRPAA